MKSTVTKGVGRQSAQHPSWWPYFLVAPVLASLALFMYFPVVKAVIVSLTDTNLLEPSSGESVGLHNYGSLLHSSSFWHIGLQTVFYTAVSVCGSVVLGVAAAVLIQGVRGASVLRALLLLPWIGPPVVTAFIWRYLYQPTGTVVHIMQSLGIVSRPIDFLADSHSLAGFGVVLWALVQVGFWSGFPFIMLLTSAALTSIPRDVYEAAQLDGAYGWRLFNKISLPLIAPVLEMGTLLLALFRFGQVDLPFLLTQSGISGSISPSGTVFGVLVYNTGFTEFEVGYGAALGIALFVLVLPLALAYVRRSSRQLFAAN
jgi:multiple sugar transport system permease protein